MNNLIERWMADATQLTRAGRLQEASDAIRAALAGKLPGMPPTGADDDVIDVAAREVPDRAPPPVAPRAGTGGPMLAGSFTDGHGSRNYKLFVPPSKPGQPMPLVVMLHGCTQDPDDFARGTRMNEAALAQGFAVLYPEQPKSANSSGCWNWFKHNHQARGRGEPALLAGMTRQVMAAHEIDPARVYVAGLSAGGAMAAILGDAYPELYAAIGVHSGLATGAARDLPSAFAAMQSGAPPAASGRSPPTIVFHGDQDSTVHPANGAHVVAASAAAHPPKAERARSTNGRSYTRQVYRDDAGRAVAEHWAVHGAGHAWSGGSPSGSYTDPTGPDASGEMLRFFFAHPLKQGG